MKVLIGLRAKKVKRQGFRKGLTLNHTHFWTDVFMKCRRWSDFCFWKIVEEFLSDSWLGANSGNVLEPLDRELCCDYKLVHIQLDRAHDGSCQRREYCARVHDVLQYRALLQLVWQKCPKGGWLRLLMIERQSNRLWLPRHCLWWLCDSLWLLPIWRIQTWSYGVQECGNHVPKSNWKRSENEGEKTANGTTRWVRLVLYSLKRLHQPCLVATLSSESCVGATMGCQKL